MTYPFEYHSLKSLHDLQQTSTVDLYYLHFNFLRLFSLYCFPWIWEDYFLSRFICGLENDIRIYVLPHHPCNLLDAYELALIQEYSIESGKTFRVNAGATNKHHDVAMHTCAQIFQYSPSVEDILVSSDTDDASVIVDNGAVNNPFTVVDDSSTDHISSETSAPNVATTIVTAPSFSSTTSIPKFCQSPLLYIAAIPLCVKQQAGQSFDPGITRDGSVLPPSPYNLLIFPCFMYFARVIDSLTKILALPSNVRYSSARKHTVCGSQQSLPVGWSYNAIFESHTSFMITQRGLQCTILCIPCFDSVITSPAFQVALHGVNVLALKHKGQHRVAFIVFLPRFYSMYNLIQGSLPVGLTKWPASAPRIHSGFHSSTFANFQRATLLKHFFICNIGTSVSKYKNAIGWCVICFDPGIIQIRFCGYKESVTFFSYVQVLVDMCWSTSKYVPYKRLLLDCNSFCWLTSLFLSLSSIMALLMELCPWHTMGAIIQVSRAAEADPHAGIRHVVLRGISLLTPFLVLNSHSVEPPIASSITKGMTQQYDQSSSVDSSAAPIMSSGSSVRLRSNAVTSMLQFVATILSILKTSIAQSCAMRCRVEVEHGAVLSIKPLQHSCSLLSV